MALTKIQQQVIDLLQKSEKILVMPSAPADGDSIGSALALYLVLKKLGKEITVVCSEPVPDMFHFLPVTQVVGNQVTASKDFIVTIDCRKTSLDTIKSEIVENKVNIIITPKSGRYSSEDVTFNYGPEKFDLLITVDCAALEQLGHLYENNIEMFHQVPVVNIDHHVSNEQHGKINYVDIMASATTELLIPLFEGLGEVTGQTLIDEDVATLLLTGIITDTGSFQNANTTPQSFASSAKLIGYGARQQEIIQHVYKTKQLSTLKLWGRILSKMQMDEKHRLVWSVITQKDFRDTESREDETGDIIDELLTNAPEAEIVLLLKQRSGDLVTGSIRTTSSSIDASGLAEMFGGGGHAQAAGFRIQNISIEDAEKLVLGHIRAFQEKRLGGGVDTGVGSLGEGSPAEEPAKKSKKQKDEKIYRLKPHGEQTIEPGTTYKFEG